MMEFALIIHSINLIVYLCVLGAYIRKLVTPKGVVVVTPNNPSLAVNFLQELFGRLNLTLCAL
jgi:hypothetical protein